MALDADVGVKAVASRPMWLHWVSESGKAGQAGWAYERVGGLPAVRAANLRWLASYRHPRYARYARAAVMAALA